MGTRTNFYKIPAYAYGGQYKLSSILDNLQTYMKLTGARLERRDGDLQQADSPVAPGQIGPSKESEGSASKPGGGKGPPQFNPYDPGSDQLRGFRGRKGPAPKGSLQKLRDRYLHRARVQKRKRQSSVQPSADCENAQGSSYRPSKALATSVLGFCPYEEDSDAQKKVDVSNRGLKRGEELPDGARAKDDRTSLFAQTTVCARDGSRLSGEDASTEGPRSPTETHVNLLNLPYLDDDDEDGDDDDHDKDDKDDKGDEGDEGDDDDEDDDGGKDDEGSKDAEVKAGDDRKVDYQRNNNVHHRCVSQHSACRLETEGVGTKKRMGENAAGVAKSGGKRSQLCSSAKSGEDSRSAEQNEIHEVRKGGDLQGDAECDPLGEDKNNAVRGAEDVVQLRKDQRFPAPGEPVCANCGRFGAYVCDRTDDDVCSVECKNELLKELAARQEAEAAAEGSMTSSFVAPTAPRGALRLPDTEPERWDYRRHKWINRGSSLVTQRCWKCKRVGHFAEDCVLTLGLAAPSPADPNRYKLALPGHEENGDRAFTPYTPEMRALYKRCKGIGADSCNAKCGQCGNRSNLAFCLDCSGIFCDGSGHLTAHLRSNPAHVRIYSYKLKREVKCSKPDCPVDNIYELYSCNDCLDQVFDRYYNMFNASWNHVGLKYVPNAFACEDHFDWHRVNCTNTASDEHCHLVTKNGGKLEEPQLSEFLF
ncbi:hypothetical protein CBR_g20284 [Chara braunii]|uniref:CCHC-type domain-containing protein n=1 Tax=Chara braunii TaxID=69332 RepID=A0A388L021_CHABU|nr:hypothetical protein CBR_g20284 [Chara braunii]|eukprot:GBG75657.1 hypothetical protein CBR_g20284 [Chara braunii]